MRKESWFAGVLVLLAVALPTSALAQTSTTTTTTQTTTQTVTYDEEGFAAGWNASLFVGSAFGADAEDATLDWGGSIGYLWNETFGAEFMAGFSPDFGFTEGDFLLADDVLDHSVNTYMFNLMGAVPIGTGTMFQPYASAGLGWVNLRVENLFDLDADALDDLDDDLDDLGLLEDDLFDGDVLREDFAEHSQFGWNVGFGAMGYGENVGVRGDVRYFRAGDSTDGVNTLREAIANDLLSDLSWWRANIGVTFRW
jgi:opacity protein-like surface antigen